MPPELPLINHKCFVCKVVMLSLAATRKETSRNQNKKTNDNPKGPQETVKNTAKKYFCNDFVANKRNILFNLT